MPIAAALPAIIPAAGSLLGGIFGGKSNAIKGITPQETLGTNILGQQGQQQLGAGGMGLDWAKELATYGRGFMGNAQDEYGKANTFLNSASNTLNPAADYYGNILSGNRAAMMDAAAPEITTINNQANQARRSLATLGPMGGGRAQALAQLPYQTAGQIGTLFQTLRPQAAQGLLNIGNARANLAGITGNMAGQQGQIGAGLGTNTLTNLLNYGSGATGTGNALLNYGINRSQQNNIAGQQFGGGIYNILNSIPWGNIFGGGANTGTSNPIGGAYTPGNWGY